MILFIIELTYNAPLDQVDAHLEGHVAFLEKHYNEGVFIASGRKIPRDGGIIIARADSKLALADMIAEDPFYRQQLADYRIIEFNVSKWAPDIASFFKDEHNS